MLTDIKYTARFTPVSVIREDPTREILDGPENVRNYWKNVIASQPDHDPTKEHLAVIIVNTRLRPFAWNLVSVGSAQECLAHPREILRPVIVANGYGFFLVHNHPGGDPSPSEPDRRTTNKMRAASKLMEIRFLDHIIVCDPAYTPSYFSFAEAGLLN